MPKRERERKRLLHSTPSSVFLEKRGATIHVIDWLTDWKMTFPPFWLPYRGAFHPSAPNDDDDDDDDDDEKDDVAAMGQPLLMKRNLPTLIFSVRSDHQHGWNLKKWKKRGKGGKKKNATPANLFGKIYHRIAKRLKTKKRRGERKMRQNDRGMHLTNQSLRWLCALLNSLFFLSFLKKIVHYSAAICCSVVQHS